MKSNPRCHLALRAKNPSRFMEYQHTPGNSRVPNVAEYSAFAFGCALRGPFNMLRSAGFSAPRLSVSARIVFISTSTVSWTILNYANYNAFPRHCQGENSAFIFCRGGCRCPKYCGKAWTFGLISDLERMRRNVRLRQVGHCYMIILITHSIIKTYASD